MSSVIVFIFTLAVSPLLVRFLNDQHRKSGREGHSRHGGVLVLLGLAIGAAYYAIQSAPSLAVESTSFLPLVLLMASIAFIGWYTDEFNEKHGSAGKRFDWIVKLTLQAIATAIACWGAGFDFSTSIVVVLAVLLMANAANMIDGIDMLAAGFLCVALVFWDSTASRINLLTKTVPVWDFTIEGTLVYLSMPVLLVFLIWNAAPAKIALGAVGKAPLGVLLGWPLGLFASDATGLAWPDSGLVLLTIFLFFLPMLALVLPTLLQALSLRFAERPLFRFQTSVLQAFLDAGWSKARILMLIVVAQVLCSSLASLVVVLREMSR
jgi:UDP-N-acetylmuramyl pentapeptide phosphotransferase/UDP-N-acetylglucosamine-1-phosphate transferase